MARHRPTLRDRIAKMSPSSSALGAPSAASTVGGCASGACDANVAHVQAAQASQIASLLGAGHPAAPAPAAPADTVGALPRPMVPRPIRTGHSAAVRCQVAGGVWDGQKCRIPLNLTVGEPGEPAGTVGISSAGYGGELGDDCNGDSDCNSGNCLLGYCAPGFNTVNPVQLICGVNQHAEGTQCVCDVGTTWIGGECIQAPDLAMISCGQSGGTWNDATGCQCPAGSQVDPRNGGCINIQANCFGPDGNPLADNTQCFVGQQAGLCMAGECRTACIDDLGNQGFFDKNGICIGTTCGLGQGRGEITGRCASCADYGFMPDGIHCRTCPAGLHYDQVNDLCECDAPTVFNPDWECVDPKTKKVVTPPSPPPPVCGPNEVLAGNKCLPKPAGVKCDPRTQIEAVDAAGLPYCKPKTPDDKAPEGEKESSNTLLYGLLAVAAAGGLALALTAKKRRGKK